MKGRRSRSNRSAFPGRDHRGNGTASRQVSSLEAPNEQKMEDPKDRWLVLEAS